MFSFSYLLPYPPISACLLPPTFHLRYFFLLTYGSCGTTHNSTDRRKTSLLQCYLVFPSKLADVYILALQTPQGFLSTYSNTVASGHHVSKFSFISRSCAELVADWLVSFPPRLPGVSNNNIFIWR